MDTKFELETLYKEYKGYFPHCELVLGSALPSGGDDIISRAMRRRAPGNHLQLTTTEGKDTKISVNEQGWHEINRLEYFATFEALMNNISPSFRVRFASELHSKLSNLS